MKNRNIVIKIMEAADCMDWQQVVLNGGDPCFHLEHNRFCGRAKRWDGHGGIKHPDHKFVSLGDLIKSLL